MGRAERRRRERNDRIRKRKEKILISREDLGRVKREITDDISNFSVEVMMTAFALAEHRLYGFGAKRIMRSLEYIDGIMGEVGRGEATVEELAEQLKDETGVLIKC